MANIRNQQLKVFNNFTAGEENVVDRHLIHDTGFVSVINVDTKESVIQPARHGLDTDVPNFVAHPIKENLKGANRSIWFNQPVRYALYGNELYYVHKEGSSFKRAYWDEDTKKVVKGGVFISIDGLKATRDAPEVEDPFADIYSTIHPILLKVSGAIAIQYCSQTIYDFWELHDKYIDLKFDYNGDIEAQYNTAKTDLDLMDRYLTQTIIDLNDTQPIHKKLEVAVKSAEYKALLDGLNLPPITERWYETKNDYINIQRYMIVAMSMRENKQAWLNLIHWWQDQNYMGFFPFKTMVYTPFSHESIPNFTHHYNNPEVDRYNGKSGYFGYIEGAFESFLNSIDKDPDTKGYTKYDAPYGGTQWIDNSNYIHNTEDPWVKIVGHFLETTTYKGKTYEHQRLIEAVFHFLIPMAQVTWAAQNGMYDLTQSPQLMNRNLPMGEYVSIPQWSNTISEYVTNFKEVRKAIRDDIKIEDYTTGAYHYYGVVIYDDAHHLIAYTELERPVYDKDTKPIKLEFSLGIEKEEISSYSIYIVTRATKDDTLHRQKYHFYKYLSATKNKVELYPITPDTGSDQDGYGNVLSDLASTPSLDNSFNLISEYNGSIFIAEEGKQRLRFTKTGKAYEMTTTTWVDIPQPIMAMQSAGAGLFIWTSDDALYLLTGYENDGSGNNTIAIKRIANGVTVKSADAVTAIDNLVVWMSNDGIHNTSGYGSAATTRGVWRPPEGRVLSSIIYNGKVYFVMEEGKTLISYDITNKYILKFSAPETFNYETLEAFEGDLYVTMKSSTGKFKTTKLFQGDRLMRYDFTLKYFTGYSYDTRLRFNNLVISHDDVPYRYKGLDTKADKTEVYIYIDDRLVATDTIVGRDATRIQIPATNNTGQGISIRCKGTLKLQSFRIRYTTHDYED